MKSYVANGTGSQQTLTESQDNKIPIYETLEDAESDLASLAENQIVAIHDTGSELSAPVDVVQSGNMHAVSSNAVAEKLDNVVGAVTVVEDNNEALYYVKLGRLIIFSIRTKVSGIYSINLETYNLACVPITEGYKTALCWGGQYKGEAYIASAGKELVVNTTGDSSGEIVAFLA